MRNKKILVTGGAGYLGIVLCEKLAKEGFNVVIFDAFYFGSEQIAHLDSKIQAVKGDIRRPPAHLFEGVDSVIHLAALSNDPTAQFNPLANHLINNIATKKIAKLAKKSGVRRFIFASSCSIYDLGEDKPSEVRDESSTVLPRAQYSSSKYKAENALEDLSDDKFDVIILRKGTIFGFSPRMRYDLVVNTMVMNAMSKGTIQIFCEGVQWRPLIDIEDVARAYFLALLAPSKKINGQILNISFDNFLIKDVAKVVRKIMKQNFGISCQILLKDSDKRDRSYRVSTVKAQKLLNFKAKVSLEESIIRLVNSVRKAKMTDFRNPIYYNIKWMRPILKEFD